LKLQNYFDTRWPIGSVSERTAKNEAARFAHVLAFLGSKELQDISGADAKDIQSLLKRKQQAPPSINQAVHILHKILVDAVDREVLDAMPRRWPKALPEQQLRNELNNDERAAFIAAFDKAAQYQAIFGLAGVRGGYRRTGGAASLYRLFKAAKPFYVVALETGLDRGELIALKKTSVDLDAGLIRVKRLKTGVTATVPISDPCRAALVEAIARSIGLGVFTTPAGKPYCVATVVRYFARAKRLAEIKRPFRFKDLRHSYGCNLVERGVPINIVKECMGHSDISTTMRYARVTESAIKEQVLAALAHSPFHAHR
jgi:integrase